MPGIKSTKIETANRVFTIQGWILNGVQDYLILKNIEQKYNVGRRQAKNLLQKAYKIWHEDQEATIEQKRSMRIAELQQDIRGMKDEYKGTPRGMAVINSIKKEISKLEALYPARTHILQGNTEKPIAIKVSVTKEEIKQISDELEKEV